MFLFFNTPDSCTERSLKKNRRSSLSLSLSLELSSVHVTEKWNFRWLKKNWSKLWSPPLLPESATVCFVLNSFKFGKNQVMRFLPHPKSLTATVKEPIKPVVEEKFSGFYYFNKNSMFWVCGTSFCGVGWDERCQKQGEGWSGWDERSRKQGNGWSLKNVLIWELRSKV